MQDFNWLEIIYDNFVLVFYLAIGCIIFVLLFTGWLIKHSIGTKVLVVRKTTAEIISAKEDIGKGTVKFKKKMFKKVGEPVFLSKLLRPYRMYIHQEGTDKVISLASFVRPHKPPKPPKKDGEESDDEDYIEDEEAISNDAFQDLLESEVIKQSVRGLVGTRLEQLILMLAGGGIFIIGWEIIRGIFT